MSIDFARSTVAMTRSQNRDTTAYGSDLFITKCWHFPSKAGVTAIKNNYS